MAMGVFMEKKKKIRTKYRNSKRAAFLNIKFCKGDLIFFKYTIFLYGGTFEILNI